jgi:hypothetical protein
MSKEKIVKVLGEYGVLSTFQPDKNDLIILTVDSNKVDVCLASLWSKTLAELYPYNSILIKLDGMYLDTWEEDSDEV